MKWLITGVLIGITLLQLSCSDELLKGRSSVGYFMTHIYPTGASTRDYRDSTLIYRNGKMLVYDLSYTYFQTKVYVNPNTGEANEEWVNTPETRHNYFAIEKDSAFGLFYDSLTTKAPVKKHVDSVLEASYLKDTQFYLLTKHYRFVASDKVGRVTIDRFINPNPNMNNPDSMIFFYNRELHFREWSLSKELDSIKKARLFKGTFVFKSKMKDGKLYPRGEWTLEMRNIPFSKDASYLIKRYPSDMEKLKDKMAIKN